MAWPVGFAEQRHLRFARGTVAFFVVAAVAGGYEVFPGVIASPAARDDVIDGEVAGTAAILTLVAVALEHVFPGKHDKAKRHPRVFFEPDYRRVLIIGHHRADGAVGVVMDQLSLIQKKEHERFPHINHIQGLIVLIQD